MYGSRLPSMSHRVVIEEWEFKFSIPTIALMDGSIFRRLENTLEKGTRWGIGRH